MVAPVGGQNSASAYPQLSKWFGYSVSWITRTAFIPLYSTSRSMLSAGYRYFSNASVNTKQFLFVKNRQFTLGFITGGPICVMLYSLALHYWDAKLKAIHEQQLRKNIEVSRAPSPGPEQPSGPTVPDPTKSTIALLGSTTGTAIRPTSLNDNSRAPTTPASTSTESLRDPPLP